MTLRIGILLLLIVSVVVVPVAFSAFRLDTIKDDIQSAERHLESVRRNGREILTLQAQQQRIQRKQRPTQDLIAKINTVLTEAGIPAGRFSRLRPESDTAVANTGSSIAYRRQSVSLSLNAMTVAEVGDFLIGWQSAQAVWTPSRIELVHARDTQSAPDSYDVTMLLSAIYVGDSDSS